MSAHCNSASRTLRGVSGPVIHSNCDVERRSLIELGGIPIAVAKYVELGDVPLSLQIKGLGATRRTARKPRHCARFRDELAPGEHVPTHRPP